MTLTLDEDEILSAAIAGVSKVAELIATVPAEERTRALEAAEKHGHMSIARVRHLNR